VGINKIFGFVIRDIFCFHATAENSNSLFWLQDDSKHINTTLSQDLHVMHLPALVLGVLRLS